MYEKTHLPTEKNFVLRDSLKINKRIPNKLQGSRKKIEKLISVPLRLLGT